MKGILLFIKPFIFSFLECFAMLYPYTSEAYNTLIRTIGFGTASGLGRLGSAFAPYILI